MGLPVTFGPLTSPVLLPDLDINFAAVGAIGTIPCLITGDNALVLAPQTNTPTVSAYANYLRFSGVISATNSTGVTLRVGALPILNCYKNTATGPQVLVAGDLFAGNAAEFIYDSALNSGAGGFHASTLLPASAGTVTSVATGTGLTGGPITATGTVAFDTITNLRLFANISGGTAIPSASSLTAILDAIIGTGRGSLISRGNTAWAALTIGSQFGFPFKNSSGDVAWGIPGATGVSATGTVQGDAYTLTAMFTEVTTTPGGTGVIMPVGPNVLIAVCNRGANTLNVYPASGASVDGGTVNVAVTIATTKTKLFWGSSSTAYYTISST